MTLAQIGSRVALTCALFVGLAAGWSEAQVPNEEDKGLQCPPPLMTCANDPDSSAARACPPGYRCACVPSCPTCLDCAARVCILAPPECRTACDCEAGLGCFEGKCVAGIAPVFCCEGPQCPAGEQCQHHDGRMDRCTAACVDHAWLCRAAGEPDKQCGEGRVCACTASCPSCEDCGEPICVPPGVPPPYDCNDDGTCRQPGDRCICVSSCPACDDCARNVCVPTCDNQCEERLRTVNGGSPARSSALKSAKRTTTACTSTAAPPAAGPAVTLSTSATLPVLRRSSHAWTRTSAPATRQTAVRS